MPKKTLDESNAADTLNRLWAAYFSGLVITKKNAENALPVDDVLLDKFSKTTVDGPLGKTWPGRNTNLVEHFKQLQPEFVGSSYLSFLLACTIVTIRKTEGAGPGKSLFFRIISEHTDHVATALNIRWLTSVCDTIVDHGETVQQRAVAMNGVILANTVKLYESEKRIYFPARPWPPKARIRDGGHLYDGVITFWGEKGDMIDNMVKRIEVVTGSEPVAGRFVEVLLEKLAQEDTIYRRFPEISGKPPVPLVPERIQGRLKRIFSIFL